MNQNRFISLSVEEALVKVQSYCAYQERCANDVKLKLMSWGLGNEHIDQVIGKLEKENFLSDGRFAELYVRSKVNQRKWGKQKIYAGLRSKSILNEIIDEKMATIDHDTYHNNIRGLIENKLKQLEKFEPFIKQQKLTRYLLSKGYEFETIVRYIK